MADLSLIDFQIFPSRYEQNSSGEKCCWQNHGGNVELGPYLTDAIKGRANPEWGFHLLSAGQPDKYRLKYVKMKDPLKYWYGVTVKDGKLVLLNSKEGAPFTVKKVGAYYTLKGEGGYVECEDGNLGNNTTIQVWDSKPPANVDTFSKIPSESFRLLWKFVKMDHMSGRDWMTKLAATKGTQTIDQIFIPGTHDSGTEKNTQMNQTQFHTIAEQAAMGIRYFDLRVDTNNWQLFHGADSGITLKQAVDAVMTHLNAHQGEFFILQITPYDKANFSAKLQQYLQLNCGMYNNYHYYKDKMPTMNEAKKKIFFLARHYMPTTFADTGLIYEQRIGWDDNTEGKLASVSPFAGTGTKVYAQDRYDGAGDSYKFDNCIKPALVKMYDNSNRDWVLNFASVANKYPIDSAKSINKWTANWLMWKTGNPKGILAVDDARPGNIANLISLNF